MKNNKKNDIVLYNVQHDDNSLVNEFIKELQFKNKLKNDAENEYDAKKRVALRRQIFAIDKQTQLQIIDEATKSDLIDKTKKAINLNDIDIDSELSIFYESCSRTNSIHTKTLYKNNINEYCKYLKRPIVVTNHKIAQQYLTYLNNKQYASRTIRVKIASISSFFTFLSHRYDCIVNPFFDLKLPQKIDKRELNICSKNDIDILIKTMKHNGQYEYALLIELMRKYGFRSGAFKNMSINNQCQCRTITKGREYKCKFNESDIKKIEKIMNVKISSRYTTIFSDINERSLQRYVVELNQKLFNENKISCAFSCHDIRHYFAISYIEKHKNNADAILKLKHILNHSSLDMTYNYLRSISYDFE